MGLRGVAGLVLAALLGASTAQADEPHRPWAEGISVENQQHAEALLAEGNDMLDKGAFADALAKYKIAIASWDHPAIRYNIAVALINLERPLEAIEHLEAALRFGPAALDPTIHQQAISYRRLLDAQIARLVVTCDLAGATVSLDGRDFVRCPGEATQRVIAGPHRVLGQKPGYLTRTIDLAIAGGTVPRVHVALMTLDDATVRRRRWSWWKPWVVVGGGALVTGVGTGFELQARATMRSYDKAVAVLCADTPCESLPTVVSDAYDRAQTQHAVGIALLAGGGLALATGVVLVVMNRAKVERVGYPAVTPLVGAKSGGVAVALPF